MEDNKSSKKIRYIFVAAVVGLVLVFSLNDDNHNEENGKESAKTGYKASNEQIQNCIQSVHDKTLYDIDRLNYIGDDGSNVVITYINKHGSLNKFKCDDGNVKLYAKGANMWIDM